MRRFTDENQSRRNPLKFRDWLIDVKRDIELSGAQIPEGFKEVKNGNGSLSNESLGVEIYKDFGKDEWVLLPTNSRENGFKKEDGFATRGLAIKAFEKQVFEQVETQLQEDGQSSESELTMGR